MPSTRLGRTSLAALTLTALALTACSSPDPVTPTASPSASPNPSTSPSVSPLAPGEMPPRLVGADDATLLDAAEHPRTGEVWLTEADDLEPAAPIVAAGQTEYFAIHVGTRGDAEIFLVVGPGRAAEHPEPVSETYDSVAFVEVRDGHAFEIACPSPTQNACPTFAMSGESEVFDSEVIADGTVFYDSLVVPSSVDVEGISVAGPYVSGDNGVFVSVNLGDPLTLVAAVPSSLLVRDVVAPATTLTTFGGWTLMTYESPLDNGLPTFPLVWVSPLGTAYKALLGDRNAALSPQTIEWADGVEPLLPTGRDASFPYSGVHLAHCDWIYSPTVDEAHDATQWTVGGSLASGAPVYVPVAGGNDWSRSLWAGYSTPNGNYGDIPAWFTSEADFLAARGVIEIEGFNGEWWLLGSANPDDLQVSCD